MLFMFIFSLPIILFIYIPEKSNIMVVLIVSSNFVNNFLIESVACCCMLQPYNIFMPPCNSLLPVNEVLWYQIIYETIVYS